MALPTIISTGDEPKNTDEAADLLTVPGSSVINHITLINEGDSAGFWRLVTEDRETEWVRLPAGGGDPGTRRAAVSIPCPGFSKSILQVKPEEGKVLTGLYAFGM